MTTEECKEYIKSKNLDLRTIEQIVSFFFDYDIQFCGKLNWWEKKTVTQAFHGNEKFMTVWPKVVKAIEAESKRRAGL